MSQILKRSNQFGLIGKREFSSRVLGIRGVGHGVCGSTSPKYPLRPHLHLNINRNIVNIPLILSFVRHQSVKTVSKEGSEVNGANAAKSGETTSNGTKGISKEVSPTGVVKATEPKLTIWQKSSMKPNITGTERNFSATK